MKEKCLKIIQSNKKQIALILVVIIAIIAVYSCSKNGEGEKVTVSKEIEDNKETDFESDEISIDIIEPKDDTETVLSDKVDEGEIDDIYSMVCSAIQYKLSKAGFATDLAVAHSVENDEFDGVGLYYYDNSIDFFEGDEFRAVGFVEVVNDTEPFYDASLSDSIIAVTEISEGDEIAGNQKICTYSYNDIGYSHFVYQNQYVTYYQQTPMRVVYSVQDKSPDNYDLSIGSLYDYDNNEYIYDESIFGEYTKHSAVNFFSEEDYRELEKHLQYLSDEQLKNGYNVTDLSIVYISPESIQAYLDSEEKDTFFGYSVKELTESLGAGTALQYTENGFEYATVASENEDEYDWKAFLTKIGIGAGIIIIGAALTPITGGASFGCALITVTKMTVGASACAALGTVAFNTTRRMIDGQSLKEALISTKDEALDSFANSFVIVAAISSVGVASGIIKPSACFLTGTKVAVLQDSGTVLHIPIEKVQIGDRVISYDESKKLVVANRVSETFENEVDETVKISASGKLIETTFNHPFYLANTNNWIYAGALKTGDLLLGLNGETIVVDSIEIIRHSSPVKVYNLTVENTHTYFVGDDGILVHNTCDSIIKRLRNEASQNTWKEEAEAIENGVSKYNWTTEQKAEISKIGKLEGYDVVHIIDVQRLKGTVNEKFIASTKNTVILRRDQHLVAHMNNWKNFTDPDVIVEFLPWAAEKVEYMLSVVG